MSKPEREPITVSFNTTWWNVRSLIVCYAILTGDTASVAQEDAQDQCAHYTDALVDYMGGYIHGGTSGKEKAAMLHRWREGYMDLFTNMLEDIYRSGKDDT